MTQADKISAFKALHRPGDPLVLFNVWDAGSAKVVADAGASAIATASWSCAAANGFEDDESFSIKAALANVTRIVGVTDLPVSFDFEGGYATEPDSVMDHISGAAQTGIAGINLEDRRPGQSLPLPLDLAVERISAAREAAPIFINARMDAFLASDAIDHTRLLDNAIERSIAFADAGADGIFVPGLSDLALLSRFCEACPLPVNAMVADPASGVEAHAAAGVSRISSGPGPYRALMTHFSRMAELVYRND